MSFWLSPLYVTFARKSVLVLFPSATSIITKTPCKTKNKPDIEQWESDECWWSSSCIFHVSPCGIAAERLSIRYVTWRGSPLSHPAGPPSLPVRNLWRKTFKWTYYYLCVCLQWATRPSTGLCTEDIWSSTSLSQSSPSFTVTFPACLRCLLSLTYEIPVLRVTPSSTLGFNGPAGSMRAAHGLRLWGLSHFSPQLLCFPRRLVPRCAVAFEENHRPQELRVPHVEAGGVPGVPSGSCRRGVCHFNDGLKC